MNVDFDKMFGNSQDTDDTVQEAYNAQSSSYSDLFKGKFSDFDSTEIVSNCNNKLKGDGFGLGMGGGELEDSDLGIGYKNDPPGFTPKPGDFFNEKN